MQRAGLLIEERAWSPLAESVFGGRLSVVSNQVYAEVNGIDWLIIYDTGSPNAAIAVERFAEFGARCAFRCGTCGSLTPDVSFGQIMIAEACFRDEGTSRKYAHDGIPAVVDQSLLEVFISTSGDKAGLKRGWVWTTDGRYVESDQDILRCQAFGISAVDMESSSFYIVARARRIPAISISVVTDEPWRHVGMAMKGRIEDQTLDLASQVRRMFTLTSECAQSFGRSDR